MKAEAPDCTTLGAGLSLGRPALHRICAIRADLGPPVEFTATCGTTRAMFPIAGGVAAGLGWQGRILPGGADFARLLPDGSYAIAARYVIEMTDGTPVMVTNKGRMFAQADGSYIGRTLATLEVPQGPYAGLAGDVLFGTAHAPVTLPECVYIELWQAPV